MIFDVMNDHCLLSYLALSERINFLWNVLDYLESETTVTNYALSTRANKNESIKTLKSSSLERFRYRGNYVMAIDLEARSK